MRIFLKIVGYLLFALFGIDIIYIILGQPFTKQPRSVEETVWHLIWAAGMLGLGIYLVKRKLVITPESNPKSRGFGIASLAISIIGLFWWPAVLGIVAAILAILQFRKCHSKIGVAGLIIGIVDYLSAAVWYGLGIRPSIF